MNIRIRRILTFSLLLAPVVFAQESDKRAFGVLPNYRTVESSAPFRPLTSRQKLTIATKDSVDGPSYVMAGVFASLYQLTDQNPSFGQGVKGYTHRYLCSIADQDIGNYMAEGFVPVLLREDPRYFRLGKGTKMKRTFYALSRVAVAKTDRGTPTFNFGEFLGNGTTASIANAYYPDEVGFGPTMQRMFTQIGTDSISNILKEYWPDVKKHLARRKHLRV
ncbi:MAG TPA: hypothetical protein VHC72_12780 [Bryobacteraceae bacterium]|nr:hypothetical protein [Bryobacteraceae bacterium]